MTATLEFTVERRLDPLPDAERETVLADPGFGRTFTDHMVLADWDRGRGWHDARVTAYGPLLLDPSTAVLHYAQEIFEGLKAYRHADGSIWAFRPGANAARFAQSAARLALPALPEEDFVGSLRALVEVDQAWVPHSGYDSATERSLYLRPFIFASEAFLGVRPADRVTYGVIASPAGPYFAGGVKPVSIWLSSDYTRAAPGGTGAAKCGGNYAASLAAMIEASAHGCEQVAFLDAVERRWIEELGGMNVFLVFADGRLVTPELTGTILEGVTRSSILTLAEDLGHKVEERRIDIDEWREGSASGDVVEVFACGTAAVVTPIARLAWDGGEVVTADGGVGPVTAAIRQTLLDVQHGRAEDVHHWMTRLG